MSSTSTTARNGAPVVPELITTVLPSNGQLLVEETEELLEATLAVLRADIAETPAWSGAPPPTDDFLLQFLRAEIFFPSKAANRYRKFWKVKVSLWGEDKAAAPPRVQDAATALNRKFCQVVTGSKDIEGRQVLFVDVGQNDKKLDLKERVRAVWHVMLSALEDVETQRRGVCILASLKTAKLSQFDPKFDKAVVDSIQGALPIRVGSMNLCYPPSFFRIVWAIVSKFLSRVLKKRLHVLSCTDDALLDRISALVAREDVPQPMGPKEIDFDAWLAERTESKES